MHDSSSVVGPQMKTEQSAIVYFDYNSCLIFNWILRKIRGARLLIKLKFISRILMNLIIISFL